MSIKHVHHGMTRKFQTVQLIDTDTDRGGVVSKNNNNLYKSIHLDLDISIYWDSLSIADSIECRV